MYKNIINSESLKKTPFIVLVGPPNSGKTTLFNYLSGKNYKTANYPGSTVEYSLSKIKKKLNFEAAILDSPGIVSLVPESLEEKISIDAICNHPTLGVPDLIITTIDVSQLSRHLLLVKQLQKTGLKILVALTMIDILNSKNQDISIDSLEKLLECDAVKIDGRNGNGIEELLNRADKYLEVKNSKEPVQSFEEIDNFSLIKLYEEIEEIENHVIISLDKKYQDNLDNANKKLVVLNSFQNPNPNLHSTTSKIDKLLLHKAYGLFFFFLIMTATFTSVFWLATPIMNLIDDLFGFAGNQLFNLIGNNWFGDFVSNGIIAGTGSVMIFVPQILILFLILGILEDTGYLARGAMLIDKPLSKIGLNGRSFVPMLSGFACAIPAMMAARTISNKRERLLTIFIMPLMSCSARLPVYALLLAFLFPVNKAWLAGLVLASIYIFSSLSSIATAGIINKISKKTFGQKKQSSFILELPAYRKPQMSKVVKNSYHNAKLYLKKAGPTILIFSMMLWFLTYFPNPNPQVNTNGKTIEQIVDQQKADRLLSSYAADIGKIIQPVMKPLGLDWRVGVSLISTFAAREVFVSSLALIFKVTDDHGALQNSILEAMRGAKIEGTNQKLFTTSTIVGLIVFFIFALQCLSTIAVSKKETGGWKIPILQLVTYTSTAYILSFIVVNGLRLFGVS